MPILVPTSPAAHLPFDLLAWASAGVLAVWLRRPWLKDAQNRLAQLGPGYLMALVVGAIPGAWLAGSVNTLGQTAPALSHSVVGALAGAIVAVEIYKAFRGISGSTGGVFVGPFALGVVIGRWGCLFAGLADRTYGTPTSLPWAVNLGDGIGRHPVQVYESLSMALFLALYLEGLARRRAWALRRGFYGLCVWYGVQRFIWEFLKPYPRLIGPFNLFHLICGGLVIYGCIGWIGDTRRSARAKVGALPVPRPDDEPVRDLP
jgi:hypothetical protein